MSRLVKKPEERRGEIIGAARHLFQTKTYAKTSMQDLMDYLDIAKGTIYHYFKSKEELLEAVVENIVETNLAEMEKILQKARGNALKKFQLLIEKGSIAKENQDLMESLHSPENAGVHIRLLAKAISRQAELYGKLIQQGCEEGIFKTDYPLECAEFILSAAQFLTDVGIYPWREEDLVRRAKAIPKLIEQQLRAPPGSFRFLLKVLDEK